MSSRLLLEELRRYIHTLIGSALDAHAQQGIGTVPGLAPAKREFLDSFRRQESRSRSTLADLRSELGRLVQTLPEGELRQRLVHDLDGNFLTVLELFLQGLLTIAEQRDRLGRWYPNLAEELGELEGAFTVSNLAELLGRIDDLLSQSSADFEELETPVQLSVLRTSLKHVALIEDQDELRNLLASWVLKYCPGVSVYQADSYEQARQVLGKLGSDSLVIADLMLPARSGEAWDSESGLSLLEDCRKRVLPVCVITGFQGNSDIISRATRWCPEAFLFKNGNLEMQLQDALAGVWRQPDLGTPLLEVVDEDHLVFLNGHRLDLSPINFDLLRKLASMTKHPMANEYFRAAVLDDGANYKLLRQQLSTLCGSTFGRKGYILGRDLIQHQPQTVGRDPGYCLRAVVKRYRNKGEWEAAKVREPLRVLIVEDNPGHHEQILATLGPLKASLLGPIEHAASIEEARRLLHDFRPNLVVLDLELPSGPNGGDVDPERGAQFLAELSACSQAAVIVNSDHDQNEWRVKLYGKGTRACQFVSKREPESLFAQVYRLAQGWVQGFHIGDEVPQIRMFVDQEKCQLVIDDFVVKLTRNELKVMTLVTRNPGLPIRNEGILECWQRLISRTTVTGNVTGPGKVLGAAKNNGKDQAYLDLLKGAFQHKFHGFRLNAIILPERAESVRAAANQSSLKEPKEGLITIILIDDNPACREYLELKLSEAGHRVLSFPGPDFQPDLIWYWLMGTQLTGAGATLAAVVDMNLGQVQGFQVVERWHQQGCRPHPLIFVTGGLCTVPTWELKDAELFGGSIVDRKDLVGLTEALAGRNKT